MDLKYLYIHTTTEQFCHPCFHKRGIHPFSRRVVVFIYPDFLKRSRYDCNLKTTLPSIQRDNLFLSVYI